MKIGVLTVKDRHFHPNMRLAQAASGLGHSLSLVNPYRMMSGICDNCYEFDIDGKKRVPDLVLPRQGSPMGDYGLAIIRQFEHMKVPLVNGLCGVTIVRNQYITLQTLAAAGLRVPNTFFLTAKNQLSQALDRLGGFPVILKLVNGMGGDGVVKAQNYDEAETFLDRHLPQKQGIVVQQFYPPRGRCDIRLFVVGSEVVGAMALTPKDDDFRANIHQNGSARHYLPDRAVEKMAVSAAKVCHLDIAGVDLIIEKDGTPRVLEVNYSPGFKGIETVTGSDIATRVIHYATSLKRVLKKI